HFVLSERPWFGRPCTRPVHADIMPFDEAADRTAARRLVVPAVRTFMQLLKPLLIKKIVVKSAGAQVHIPSWHPCAKINPGIPLALILNKFQGRPTSQGNKGMQQ